MASVHDFDRAARTAYANRPMPELSMPPSQHPQFLIPPIYKDGMNIRVQTGGSTMEIYPDPVVEAEAEKELKSVVDEELALVIERLENELDYKKLMAKAGVLSAAKRERIERKAYELAKKIIKD